MGGQLQGVAITHLTMVIPIDSIKRFTQSIAGHPARAHPCLSTRLVCPLPRSMIHEVQQRSDRLVPDSLSDLPLVGNKAPDFEFEAIFDQEFIKRLDEMTGSKISAISSMGSRGRDPDEMGQS
ncbi:hypothetical protein Cni_G05203 [Canna indica]|uniref:Uncharacterized protein n=1 Tax=Canna indica TaxID=4628 RepID=A0AAQ3JUU1_9LILI|nr:hypothetical protein Cni_G05203 [Canna indica]